MKKELNILLVEDNEGDVRIINELLNEQSYIIFNITRVCNLKDTINIASKSTFDTILLDLGLPDSVGLETLITLNRSLPNLPTTIILTGLNDTEVGFKAVNNGAQDFIIKGQVDSDKLIKSIVYSNERSNLNIELKLQLEAKRVAEEAVIKLNEDLEHRVNVRTKQLEAANIELESFSYSVSHDLRAPLRHINGFSEILKNDYHDLLPKEAQHHLNSIIDSAFHMNALIDDLLNLSRTSRIELKKTSFMMHNAVNDAFETIDPSKENHKVDLKMSSLPEVNGDYNLIRLVWVNLLDNAIKYSRTREKTLVHIECKEEKEELIFCISDNGVGFDMNYAQKLFGVFQRLHSRSEFEGTGIGLANVRRIISRHGGRTWAESELGKGASFYFTLPILKKNKWN